MKKLKNLEILWDTLVPLLLAGTITIAGSSIKKENKFEGVSFETLISMSYIKENTLLDELLEHDYLLEKDINIVEASNRLEEYIAIVERLDKINFSDSKDISQEEEISMDNVSSLIELSKKGTKEEKVLAKEKLKAIKKECIQWIHENGKRISIDIMMSSVKSAIASKLDMDVEEYSNIKIPPRMSSEARDYWIIIGEERYRVPLQEGNLWDTINYIYEVQSSTLTSKTEYETYKKSLDYAKKILSSGVIITGNTIEEEDFIRVLKENYKK